MLKISCYQSASTCVRFAPYSSPWNYMEQAICSHTTARPVLFFFNSIRTLIWFGIHLYLWWRLFAMCGPIESSVPSFHLNNLEEGCHHRHTVCVSTSHLLHSISCHSLIVWLYWLSTQHDQSYMPGNSQTLHTLSAGVKGCILLVWVELMLCYAKMGTPVHVPI